MLPKYFKPKKHNQGQRYYVIIYRSIGQGKATILNVYEPNNTAAQYVKQKEKPSIQYSSLNKSRNL